MNDSLCAEDDDSPAWFITSLHIGGTAYYRAITQNECESVQKAVYDEHGERLTPEQAVVELYTAAISTEDCTMMAWVGPDPSAEVKAWVNMKRIDHFVLTAQKDVPTTPYKP
jgi:hypothetical protein